MNNQVKLIDPNKVDAYIEQRQRSGDGSEELWMLQQEMRAGTFDPDTPLVPTIKPGDKGFKCKTCNETFSAFEWNLSTALYCGTSDVSPIETTSAGDAFFICPGCETESDRANLEVVE